jgi:hypothetical protein
MLLYFAALISNKANSEHNVLSSWIFIFKAMKASAIACTPDTKSFCYVETFFAFQAADLAGTLKGRRIEEGTIISNGHHQASRQSQGPITG